MNWDAIGAVAEVLGAAAVLLTLVYLALQIKQTNMQSLDDATEALISNFNNMRLTMIESEEVVDIFLKGQSGEAISDKEFARYRAMIGFWLSTAWGLFERIRNGTVNLDFDYLDTMLTGMLESKGAKEAWNSQKHAFPENFRSYVEDCLRKV